MKSLRTYPFRFGLTAACLSLAATTWPMSLTAQVAPPPTAINAESPWKVLPKIEIINVHSPLGRTIGTAVDELQRMLVENGQPELNVLFGPKADMVPTPGMILKNVNGPDALRLIVASVGCELESISGTEGRPIGYRVVVPRAIFDTVRNGSGASDAELAGIQHFIRIYSLGGLPKTTKFSDIEATLRYVFKTAGVPGDRVALAFHEGTNVLVVTGGKSVQELVQQLFDTLQNNAALAEVSEKQNSGGEPQENAVTIPLRNAHGSYMITVKKLEKAEAQPGDAQQALEKTKTPDRKP